MCEKITTFLDEKQAHEVVVIPLEGKSSLTNYLVIASGQSSRQIVAMGESLYKNLKSFGIKPKIEGLGQSDWVIVDANDVIVHLFKPEIRQLYNLEKMWSFQLPSVTAI